MGSPSPAPSGTPAPPKPADLENGSFSALLHDQPSTQTVLAVTMTSSAHLTPSITSGASLFRVAGLVAYDLVLKQVDPSTLPAGSPPQFFWDQENPVTWDGVHPLHVKHGQRVQFAVALDIPSGAVAPGPVSGAALLAGGSHSHTVSLAGSYLGVDPNTLIGEKWASLGGEAFFGPVLSNAHTAADGKGTVQEFANGALYQVPSGPSRSGILSSAAVRDSILAAIGAATPDAPSAPAASVSRQTVLTSGSTFASSSAALAAPGALSPAGAPPALGVSVRPGQAISATGDLAGRLDELFVFYLSHRIYAKWLSLSNRKDAGGNPVWSALGFPTQDTFPTPEGGEASRFHGGAIIARAIPWTRFRTPRSVSAADISAFLAQQAPPAQPPSGSAPASSNQSPRLMAAPLAAGVRSGAEGSVIGAASDPLPLAQADSWTHVVYGAIYGRYLTFGDISDPTRQPFMGLPTSDEQPALAGRVSHFDGADIYWSRPSGAHEVHGAIRQHWLSLGGPAGFLGFPTTDETGTPDGVGRYNNFQGGVIYWTGSTGAWEVQGAILDKWRSLGAEQSYLGYPVSDEMGLTIPPFTDTFRVSRFQFGDILWTADSGATDIPQSYTTPSQSVLTPAGTALGGFVFFTFQSNGDYTVNFHMHDSGFPDYDFQVTGIFTTQSGLSLAASHGGHVEGTASTTFTHAPNRDDDFSESGNSSWVQQHWADIPGGQLWVTKDYSATGVVGVIEDVAKGILDVAVGVTSLEVGVVIGIGSEIGRVFGELGIGAAFGVIAGTVVFAFGGGIVVALVAGVGVTAVVDIMIQQRQIYNWEYDFADSCVFKGSLPSMDKIYITNLTGLGGKAFTFPGVDGKTYINMGDGFSNALSYTRDQYQTTGQLLVHELTHAWQIEHSTFVPGLVCNAAVDAANKQVSGNVYQYGPPGPAWSSFGVEQQGAIVDQWFAGISTPVVPYRKPHDSGDPYFIYIRDNIRKGVT